jgi:hypothetical protein
MPIGKDPRDKHFVISMIKSVTRMLGCFLGIAFQSITVFALLFLVAEILGVYEEL